MKTYFLMFTSVVGTVLKSVWQYLCGVEVIEVPEEPKKGE